MNWALFHTKSLLILNQTDNAGTQKNYLTWTVLMNIHVIFMFYFIVKIMSFYLIDKLATLTLMTFISRRAEARDLYF